LRLIINIGTAIVPLLVVFLILNTPTAPSWRFTRSSTS